MKLLNCVLFVMASVALMSCAAGQKPEARRATPTANKTPVVEGDACRPDPANAALPEPRLIVARRPEYKVPKNLPNGVVNGEAVAKFTVGEDGVVRNVVVIRSTDPVWAESVKEMLLNTKYCPPIKDGKPVSVEGQVPMSFKIN